MAIEIINQQTPQNLAPTLKPQVIGDNSQVEGGIDTPLPSTAWQMSGIVRDLWKPLSVFLKPLPRSYRLWLESDPEVPGALEQCLDILGVPAPLQTPGGGGIGAFMTVGMFCLAMFKSLKGDISDKKTNSGGLDLTSPDNLRKFNIEQSELNGESHGPSKPPGKENAE